MDGKDISLAELEQAFEGMKTYLVDAARSGESVERVERELHDQFRQMGFLGVQRHIESQGKGDVGETFRLEDGRLAKRLERLHARRYVSIYGEHRFERCVYGTRETQKIEAVPLDARLNLPEGDFSYVLQDWDQSFCVQNGFQDSAQVMEKILGLRQSVRSLESMNQVMAGPVELFRMEQETPPAEEEGELMVTAADGKGIPMRRKDSDRRPENPQRLKKGEKRNKKRMACVGAAYTINRFVRTPDEILNEMLHEKAEERRPRPQHKRIRADLVQEVDGEEIHSHDVVMSWLAEEVQRRNPSRRKRTVFLSDGERGLEVTAEERLPADTVFILDIYHALEPLWKVAYCFCPEGSGEAARFVEHRLRMLLEGRVGDVLRGLRQIKTKRKLRGSRASVIHQTVGYYERNRYRMRYDEYLAAGYPIGSGAVEGACRNLVKDRMERTGMRWCPKGAQAMLNLRATYLNGEWDAYCSFRVQLETGRLYPYRHLLENVPYN